MPTAQNIVSRLAIGHSAPSELDRHVGYGIKEMGWSAVTDVMEAEYQYGIRRWFSHNNWGQQKSEGPFQLDQYQEAKKDGLDWLVTGFSTELRAWLKAHPGTEFIAYIGTVQYEGWNDPDFARLQTWDKCPSYLRRFATAIDALTVPGVSIGFDHAARMLVDHPMSDLIHFCSRYKDTKVYIEPMPWKNDAGLYSHWNGFSYIADCGGALPSWTPPGMDELIAIMPMHLGRDRLLAECRKYLAAGYSVTHHATNYAGDPSYDGFRELGITIADLIE